MSSLKSRLNKSLSTGLILFFIVQWLVLFFAIRYFTESYIKSRLIHDAESLLIALKINDKNIPSVDLSRINPTFRKKASGHYFHLKYNNHSLYSQSLNMHSLSIQVNQNGQSNLRRGTGANEQPILIYESCSTKLKSKVCIAVGEDISKLNWDILLFTSLYILVACLVLFLLLVLQQRIIQYGLQPLQLIIRDVKDIEIGKRQVLREDSPLEITPLVMAFNQLIVVLDKRLQRSRYALGNLSHSLKIPISIMRQVMENKELSFSSREEQLLDEQIDKIQYLMEQQLSKARMSGATISNKPFYFKEEISVLIEVLNVARKNKNIHVQVNIPDGLVFYSDREDMLELLGNILDNAFKWAKSIILVEISKNDYLSICIQDDGPGTSKERLDELTQRGVREDEQVDGHGLGLSICKEIIDTYSGRINLSRSEELGGFQVHLQLPIQE